MNEQTTMLAFSLISDAGDASAKFLAAISESEKGNFDEAEKLLKDGEESLVKAHKKQTDLLQDEVRGNSLELSLLMVHAQDHLMNAILLKDLTKSITLLNKKVKKLESK